MIMKVTLINNPVHCFDCCYLLLQFSTDFYKVWFSGICIGQRLYILIFIKIFACLRPLWPPKPRKTFYFITASMPTVRWRQSTLLPGYLPVSCLIIIYLNLTLNFEAVWGQYGLKRLKLVQSHSNIIFQLHLNIWGYLEAIS